MKVINVALEFLEPEAGYGPTVALTFGLCSSGVWEQSLSFPPHFVLPDGTGIQMSKALNHPRHTAFPFVTDGPASATFVWDATQDGVDPSQVNWIRRHLTFRLAYSNVVCNQVPTDDPPPPPPDIPPDPILDPQEPEAPPGAPATPGAPPVIPVDIDTPTVIPVDIDPGPGLGGDFEDPVDVGAFDTEVPGMPAGTDVEETTVSPVDSMPEDPTAPVGTITEDAPTTVGSGLPSGTSPVDGGADQQPVVISVPDDVIAPTEDPATPETSVSYGGEQPGDFVDPGADPGTEIPFPNQAGGSAALQPVSYNPYNAPLLTISVVGKDAFIDGDTGLPMYVAVQPWEVIPHGHHATVLMGVQNNTLSDVTGVGFAAEYEDGDGVRTTIGLGPQDRDILATGVYMESFAFETARFEIGDTGVIRAWTLDPDLTCRAYVEQSVYLMPEVHQEGGIPSEVPLTVIEAIQGVDFEVQGALSLSTHPTYYVQATRADSAGFAVLLHPYAAESDVTVDLEYGGFDGAGARTAATHTSSLPLRTPNGIELDPGTHHVALLDLSPTPGTRYWIQVKRTSAGVSPNFNFTLYGGGFHNENKAKALPNLSATVVIYSRNIEVHPRALTTSLNASGGLLAGGIYLPYEGENYMIVNERTSDAVVVEAKNQTDVQADAVPAGAKIPAESGDSVIVYRIQSDHDLEIVGRFPVA